VAKVALPNTTIPSVRWVGMPPDQIQAARVEGSSVDMTRPVCPYPQVAKYSGIGSTRDAQNFVCAAPGQ
jgi:feruloyl esterase